MLLHTCDQFVSLYLVEIKSLMTSMRRGVAEPFGGRNVAAASGQPSTFPQGGSLLASRAVNYIGALSDTPQSSLGIACSGREAAAAAVYWRLFQSQAA